MKSTISIARFAVLAAVLGAFPVAIMAQDDDSNWNHFGLNLRAGFNVRAKFSEATSAAVLPFPISAEGAVNRHYTDGYVDVDSSGNQGGQTWNWGYHNGSQITDEGGTVVMHATGSTGGSSQYVTDDPNVGLDLNYVRDITHQKWGRFGIKIAFGYTPIGVHDHDPISGGSETIADSYALNGVVAPTAPYSGSFSGPGPVLSSTPFSRTVTMGSAGGLITGTHDVDASLYDLRLGPSFDFPLGKGFSIEAGGGVAVGLVDSEFKFSENTGAAVATGDVHNSGLRLGGYAEVGLAYRVCHSASIFTGAQIQSLGTFNQSVAGRNSRLDIGQTIFYELGFEWGF
jgi:hypothetical protein